MGPPLASLASTSAEAGAQRRRSARLIGPPRRDNDDQDQPPPCSETASTPSQPQHRSTSMIRIRKRVSQPPPPSRASTPPPVAEADAPSSSAGAVTPRRSARVQLRVRGLPSASSSSTPRRCRRSPTATPRKSIDAKAVDWGREKAASGVPEEDCVLPFLRKGAPRKVECLICSKSILPDERMQCSVNHCDVTLHKACSEETGGCCPRHWSCPKKIPVRRTSRHRIQRTMPVCTECLLKGRKIDSEDLSRKMICWSIWPSTSEDAGPTDDIKEAFRRLPLPYIDQEFTIDPINKQDLETESEPPPYVLITDNHYVVKKKSDGDAIGSGCISCDHDSTCESSCSCRSSMSSCSSDCPCSVKCSNKPFRRDKKIEIVKTQQCGWGAVALESIGKDDFVIEFVGEVIDDAMCEDRLLHMRQRRDQNFYMCKVGKDFVIDATLKGNACRFFNHSCQPNCRLEKWQVGGKTRLGVFASQTIKVGMPLTYNYRYHKRENPLSLVVSSENNCRSSLQSSCK